MSFFKANHSEAQAGFEPLPVGEWEVAVTKTEVKTSSNGNPQIKLELTVRDVHPDHKGRKFFDQLTFTDKTGGMINAFLKAAGFPDGTDFDTIEQMATAIAHKPLRLKNKHEMYQGEKKDRVSYYMPSQAGAVKAGEIPTPSASPAPASAPQAKGDDLPF